MQWSPAKERVFCFDTDIVVSAGAGSGKTAALVELYLRLLAGQTSRTEPLTVNDIVAITFTDKAAMEMKERVRQGAQRRLAAGDSFADWRGVLRDLTAARISTFHSLCATILRQHPLEGGVDPAFTVLDEFASRAERSAALDELLREELTNRSEDLASLLAWFPLSGQGKGRGIREYLLSIHGQLHGAGFLPAALSAPLKQCEARAQELFAATLRTLPELLVEVERLLNGKPAIFHRSLAALPSLLSKPLIIGEEESFRRILDARSCISGNWGKANKELRDRLTATFDTLAACSCQLLTSPAAQALLTLVARFDERYALRKRRRGGLDFDDLQLATRHLLMSQPELRQELLQAIPILMVDEFQDTNPLQRQLVELLCGADQRLFVVGDPKQSIYLFRGADVTIFRQTERQVVEKGGELIFFQESFRSRPGILAFVNTLFPQIMAGGGSDYQVPFTPDDHLLPQRPDETDAPCVEQLTVTGESADERRRGEARAIARRIQGMMQLGGVMIGEKQGDGTLRHRAPRFGDIAILFRRFSNLKLFESELRHASIPYQVVKGKGFYQCQEVLDILAMLKLVDSTADLVSLAAVIRSPFCCCSDETLYLLGRCGGGLNAWRPWFAGQGERPDPESWQRIDGADQRRLERLVTMLKRLRPIKDRLGVAELLEEILEATSFGPILITTYQGEQKLANIGKLLAMARGFSERGGGSLRPFCTLLAELVESEPTEAEAVPITGDDETVKLMTIHQSKGLEFPVVFVPEIGGTLPPATAAVTVDEERGIGLRVSLPGGDSVASLLFTDIAKEQKIREEAEQQRLFYVAVTRAKDHLVLSGEGRGEWRQWLDLYRQGEHGHLITLVDAAELAELPLPQLSERILSPITSEKLAAACERVLHYHPSLPQRMVFSPTALEDFRHCPRKYFFKGVLGLDEGLFASLLGSGTLQKRQVRGALSPLERGNLAHLLLQRLDFSAAPDEQRRNSLEVARLATVGGKEEELATVIDDVLRAAHLLAPKLLGKELFREHPFTLSLQGEATYLIAGAMDLLAVDDETALVYDYKYLQRQGANLSGYQFQLRSYLLTLARAFPDRKHWGALLFLRGGELEEVTLDEDPFALQLVTIMDSIRRRSSEEDFDLRHDCDGSNCPFRQRCGR